MAEPYLTINKFSELSGVEVSRLRHYEEIGLFMPIYRDPVNNYRYYSPSQLLALNFITTLSDLNLPLKTIGELRQQRNPDMLLQLFDQQEKRLDMEIQLLRIRSSIIHARRELISYGSQVQNGYTARDGRRVNLKQGVTETATIDEDAIAILYREAKDYHLWPRNQYNEGDTFIQPMASFVPHATEHHINLSFPVGGLFDNFEAFVNDPKRPNHFISIDPMGRQLRPAGDFLIGFTRGEYGDMGTLPQRMADHIQEHALTVTGFVYLLYLHDECSTPDPENYLAQVCVEVVRR